MKIFNNIREIDVNNCNSVITLGKFDGVHRGHQELIKNVLKMKNQGLASVVFEFDMFPATILSFQEKCRMFDKEGIDSLVNCPFTAEIISMSAEDFVRKVLCGILNAKCIVVGCDFRFGYKRQGNVELLRKLGAELGFDVIAVPHVVSNGERISSTLVRSALEKGDIERANELLGYNYFISGEVVRGAQVGRTIGFPTTNIVPTKDKILPLNGVYITRTEICGKWFDGITDIGLKPTVDGKFRCVETFLFDCDENLYGFEQKVQLLEFVREERKFASLDELKKQLEHDIEKAKQFFKGIDL